MVFYEHINLEDHTSIHKIASQVRSNVKATLASQLEGETMLMKKCPLLWREFLKDKDAFSTGT